MFAQHERRVLGAGSARPPGFSVLFVAFSNPYRFLLDNLCGTWYTEDAKDAKIIVGSEDDRDLESWFIDLIRRLGI